MHNWLENNRIFGGYITNYRKYRAIKHSVKITSVVLLCATFIVSAHLAVILLVHIALALVGVAVTAHLLRIKTLEIVLALDLPKVEPPTPDSP